MEQKPFKDIQVGDKFRFQPGHNCKVWVKTGERSMRRQGSPLLSLELTDDEMEETVFPNYSRFQDFLRRL